jgi:serine/alanine racemase
VIVLTYFIIKKLKFNIVLILSLFLFIIGLFGDSYYNLIPSESSVTNFRNIYESVFITTRNGLFFGMLFFNLGGIVDKIKVNIKFKSILLIVSFILLTLEVFILEFLDLSKDYNLMIFLIPVSVLLLSILLEYRSDSKKEILNLRDFSFLIYVIHFIPIIAVNYFFRYINYNSSYFYSLILFTCTILLSFLFSFVILKLSHYKYFTILKNLYL